jgi:hypothetical protein
MIIWQGLGIVVVIVIVLVYALTRLFINNLFGDDRYYDTHGWPHLIWSFVTGAIVLVVGRYLSNKSDREAKVVIDRETGREVILKTEHSLFFINVKYWGYIIFVLGIIFFYFGAAATPVTAQQKPAPKPMTEAERAELYERLKGVEPASPEKQNIKFCDSCLPEKLRITSGAV